MKKLRRAVCAALTAAVLLGGVTATAAGKTASASRQRILVDGSGVEAQAYAVGGYNYFRLQDLAAMLSETEARFSLHFDENAKTVAATTGAAYTPAGDELTLGEDGAVTCVESDWKLLVDGAEIPVESYEIGGSLYFRLRTAASALGFCVDYDEKEDSVVIRSAAASVLSFADMNYEGTSGEGYTLYSDIPYVPNAVSLQKLDIYVPDGEAPEGGWPVFFYIHGGGFKQGDKAKAGNELNVGLAALREGFALVSVNYRLSGTDVAPAQAADVKAAVRYIRANADNLGFNPEIFGAFAPSAGGNLTALLAYSAGDPAFEPYLKAMGAADASDDIQAVALMHPCLTIPTLQGHWDWLCGDSDAFNERYAGYMDKRDFYADKGNRNKFNASCPEALVLGGAIEEHLPLAELVNSLNYVDAGDPPTLLRHGDLDETVPFPQSIDLADKLTEAGVEVDFALVEGAEHGALFNFFQVYDGGEIVTWMAETLGVGAAGN